MIDKLKEFPSTMEVMDSCFDDIISIRQATWVHNNYPYNLPDREVVIIE